MPPNPLRTVGPFLQFPFQFIEVPRRLGLEFHHALPVHPRRPLAFFTWHDRIEDNHAAHTAEELREAYDHPDFNGEIFLKAAAGMLDGVQAFWWGLDEDRRRRHGL